MERLSIGIGLLAALLAGPALAQDDGPICGGISLVGEWAGGTEIASDLAEFDAPVELEGRVPIAGHLVRMFTLGAETEIRLDLAAIPSGDPYVTIFDAAGTQVADDDDGGGDFAARVVATLPPDTYCIAARSYELGVTDVAMTLGPASLFDERDDGPPPPPPVVIVPPSAGCRSDVAPSLGRDLTADGMTGPLTLDGSGDATSAIRFSLAGSMALSITAESEEGDPLIRLLDADGALLEENDDFDGLNARIDLTEALEAGEYCIKLEDLNGGANPVSISLLPFDPIADRLERIGHAEFPPTDIDDVPVTQLGTLSKAIAVDVMADVEASWLQVDLPEGGLVLTEVAGGELDPVVTIFDRAGRRMGENDDGPTGLDSFLALRMPPGTYLVAIRLIEGRDAGGPVRLVMERYLPAQ